LHLLLDGRTVDTLITVIGSNPNTLETIHPTIRYADGALSRIVAIDSTAELFLTADKDMRSDVGFDSLQVILDYDEDGIGTLAFENSEDYRIVRKEQTLGKSTIVIAPVQQIDTRAGRPLLRMSVKPIVGKNAEGWLRLTSLTVNGPEQISDDCTYRIAVDTSEHITLIPGVSCGQDEIRDVLAENPFLRSVSITPNPARGAIALSFNATSELRCSLRLVDALGETVSTLPARFIRPGVGTLTIPAKGMAAGMYRLVLESITADGASYQTSRSVMLIK
jgi:hypothetical protein